MVFLLTGGYVFPFLGYSCRCCAATAVLAGQLLTGLVAEADTFGERRRKLRRGRFSLLPRLLSQSSDGSFFQSGRCPAFLPVRYKAAGYHRYIRPSDFPVVSIRYFYPTSPIDQLHAEIRTLFPWCLAARHGSHASGSRTRESGENRCTIWLQSTRELSTLLVVKDPCAQAPRSRSSRKVGIGRLRFPRWDLMFAVLCLPPEQQGRW